MIRSITMPKIWFCGNLNYFGFGRAVVFVFKPALRLDKNMCDITTCPHETNLILHISFKAFFAGPIFE